MIDLDWDVGVCRGTLEEGADCATADAPRDPGPLPESMARVPGFVSEVMDYTLSVSPVPNPILAFCGAFALQAHLAGRKVRDSSDARTNFYLLALANPGAGKDMPRKVNVRILHEVGLSRQVANRFASGEGLQDALLAEPAMFFQTDEIAGMLNAINKAKDGRHENTQSELLSVYSSADSIYQIRKKANFERRNDPPLEIDQPCLNLLGTAPPKQFYEALSERMLTNGLFARMVAVEANLPVNGRKAPIRDVPASVIDAARYWAEFAPRAADGNLSREHPRPLVVESDDDAEAVLDALRRETQALRNAAAAKDDLVAATLWSRCYENARKFALVHAISSNHFRPRVDGAAADWATAIVRHLTRRMHFMATQYVHETPIQARKQTIVRLLRNAVGGKLQKSALTRKTQGMTPKERDEALDDLANAGTVRLESIPGTHRPTQIVHLIAPL